MPFSLEKQSNKLSKQPWSTLGQAENTKNEEDKINSNNFHVTHKIKDIL